MLLALSAAAVAASAAAGAQPRPVVPPAVAEAVGVQVLVPGRDPLVSTTAQAPPASRSPLEAESFAFPEDGSIVRIESVRVAASVGRARPRAAAAGELSHLSLFNGEITADAIVFRSRASARADGTTGDFAGTSLTNLVILGSPVTPDLNLELPLADWGHAIVLEQEMAPGGDVQRPSYRGTITALEVVLDADHGGLPAGTRILIGFAEARARYVPPRRQLPVAARETPRVAGAAVVTAAPRKTAKAGLRRAFRAPESEVAGTGLPLPYVIAPPAVVPRLTAAGYVFPIYGPVAYGNTFGAPRAEVGWHHGEDIFAPLGAPVLAVTDGTVFSVGWNRLGGNRLWLRDREGNEFYYAHLAAFSPLAVNGREVEAGDVLGFVGNSGDADRTPYHLHFEIHPVSLRFLEYDGVVPPYSFLNAWRHLRDLRFPSGAAWAPSVAPFSKAPTPGAILLEASDISSASGLEPASLERAMDAAGDDGAVAAAAALSRG